MKITAKQALQLAREKDPMYYAMNKIMAAAKEGLTEVKLFNNFWASSRDSDSTPEWKSKKKELESLGYAVSFIYIEKQFVEFYTLVSWAEADKEHP